MLVRRSIAGLSAVVLMMSLLVTAPAFAQSGDEPEVDYTSSEMFDKVLLEEDIGEPMALDITPDGRILLTARGGTLRIHDPQTGETVVAAEIDTYTDHYPDGNNEGGLLAVAVDPDFEDNGWVYLYYAHPDPDEWKVLLSRFELVGDALDMDSEIVMLEVESQRQDCCHLGADLEFDPAGDLYLSIGDETNPFESSGYAPIDERPGRQVFDAQRTAGNTNDLRGKILRITPQTDGSYTIPEGNLFPPDEYDEELARPEIYVMGARNPFRIAIDDESGWLYYGMFGPGATSWHDVRGPMGFDQWHQVREASNQGWPFCTGDNYPYTPWDFATNQPAGDPFDCENGPVNDSPNNTGLTELPPVEPATIYYPTNWNNYPFEPPEPFLALGTGAGGPLSGPIYHYDPDLESDTKFPEYFDGRWFLLEWHRNYIKTAELDEDGEVVAIDDFMDDTTWLRPHDAAFGPDGSLYVVEYGSGWFSGADDNGLYRVDWVGDSDDPDPPEECIEETVFLFEGDQLDRDDWPRIVREDPDGYRVEDGALFLETAVGDMIREFTDAPNLILQPLPEGAWQATTQMTLDPSDPWQQGGLIVYGDDDNFIKVPLAFGGANRHLEFILQANGQARATQADWIVVPDDVPDTIHLRVTSDGSQAIGEYSVDGESWTPFGRPAPLDTIEDAHVGFFAARGPDPGPITEAQFHDFTLGVDVGTTGPDDDFEGDELDRCIWTRIVREDPDGFSVGDGSLTLLTAVGDMIRDTTTAPNIILQPLPDGEWSATTEMTFDPSDAWQQAGLIVYDDDQNFVKAPLVYASDGSRRFEFILHVDGEARATDADWEEAPDDLPTTIQLRLTSDGSSVVAEYSTDGEQWSGFGRPASLSGMDEPHIGFVAARGPAAGPITEADFHWFTLDDTPPPPECDAPSVPDEYRALWDGTTLDGWNQAGPGGFAVVPDVDREGGCALESIGDPAGLGMLWHEDEFESYRLHTGFKAVAEDDNSGVFVGFPDPGDDPWVGVNEGFEVQIDDTGGFPDAPDSSKTGAIYTFQAPTSFPTVAGEWNTMEIEVDDPMIRVWINDVLVNEFENPNGSGRDLSSGYVGIQNNRPSDTVFFRDIWIRELEPEPPSVAASVEPSEPDGEDGWYVSPVTLTLESDTPDALLQWRAAGDDEWTTWTEPVTFDADGLHDLEYRATTGDGSEPGEPETTMVEVGAGGAWEFAPDDLTVTQGDTVRYELVDGFHNVVTVDEDGDEVATSGPPSTDWGGPYDWVAEEAGVFYIYCDPHAGTGSPDPSEWTGMVGRIVVEEAPDPGLSSEIGELSFQLDQTAPETSADLEGEQDGDVHTGDVTVTLDASDATSGVAETHYRFAGDSDVTVYDGPFTVSDDGEHTIEFRSVDVAGNVEEWTSVTFTIDTPEPEPVQPETISDCRDGGWRQFTDPSFANQGRCVAWVVTGGGGGPPGGPPGRPGAG